MNFILTTEQVQIILLDSIYNSKLFRFNKKERDLSRSFFIPVVINALKSAQFLVLPKAISACRVSQRSNNSTFARERVRGTIPALILSIAYFRILSVLATHYCL